MVLIPQEKLDALRQLCEEFLVERLELFGSAVGSTFDPRRSDLDLLVSFRPEAEPRLAELFLDLIDRLRQLLGRDIDLVMDRSVRNPDLRRVIDQQKKLLYAA